MGCHADANPANYTPVGEDVPPSYYFTPDAVHPNKPTNPCNPTGEEDFAGSGQGLDNDGDNLYDTSDPDCPAVDDSDGDGIPDGQDNCPDHPNGPSQGTCTEVAGVNLIVSTGQFCTVDEDCDPGEFCEKTQADTYPPGGNGIGDACDCEGNFNCDTNVDATDVATFLADFGRSIFFNPCTNAIPCDGDFLCDVDVDADDVTKFLEDFGRSTFFLPCPICSGAPWCSYP
jgi:hypothetical protein